MKRISLVVNCFAVLLLMSNSATAQDEQKDKETRIASELFAKGRAYYKDGEFEAAISAFISANAVKPNPVLFYYIANAHKKLGNSGEAIDYYKKFLASKDEDSPGNLKKLYGKAISSLNELRTEVPEPQLIQPEPDLPEWVEEKPPEQWHDSETKDEEPELERRRPTLQAEAEETTRQPQQTDEEVTQSSGSGWRTLGWVSLTVGIAGLVAGGICGGMALSKKGDLDEMCPDRKCQRAAWSEVDTYDTLRYVSSGGLIGGGILTGLGIILVVTHPSTEVTVSKSIIVKPYVAMTGLGIQGNF